MVWWSGKFSKGQSSSGAGEMLSQELICDDVCWSCSLGGGAGGDGDAAMKQCIEMSLLEEDLKKEKPLFKVSSIIRCHCS